MIVAVMLASMMVTMIPTASAAWDGSSASAALVGSGTEFDPYLISSENDLAFVAKQVNNGTTTYAGEHLKLTVDLDLGGHNWNPIGQLKANPFSGSFDGDGHIITGLAVKTIDDKNAIYGGVFGCIIDGTVRNLSVDGAKINSAKYAGGIAGVLNVTAGTGSASIVNCHVSNCELFGLQPGGIVGRTSTKKANKGQITVTGCSSVNNTLSPCTTDDFPSADMASFYMGGIVGAAGVAVISGCWVETVTLNAFGDGNPWVGGIVGVHGADSVAADINNCYVNGVTINVDPSCNPSKGSYGGLIGKAAHVAVAFGDPNTEGHIFNCFASDVTINDPTGAVNVGILMGLVNDTIYFNDIYYVAKAGMTSFGYDKFLAEWPFVEVTNLSEIKAAELNSGNSTEVWKDDIVLGHPTIDVDALLTNQPVFVDYYVEHAADTTVEDTTEAPADDTTEAPVVTDEITTEPVDTTAGPVVDDTTKEPAQTTAEPTAPEKKGCGGMIAGGAVIVAILGTAIVCKKKH